MTSRQSLKMVRVGDYVAEVSVTLLDDETEWAPYLSFDDAKKLQQVREALRREDLQAASKLGRVFRLTPVTV